jgi:hypothetical protein
MNESERSRDAVREESSAELLKKASRAKAQRKARKERPSINP